VYCYTFSVFLSKPFRHLVPISPLRVILVVSFGFRLLPVSFFSPFGSNFPFLSPLLTFTFSGSFLSFNFTTSFVCPLSFSDYSVSFASFRILLCFFRPFKLLCLRCISLFRDYSVLSQTLRLGTPFFSSLMWGTLLSFSIYGIPIRILETF